MEKNIDFVHFHILKHFLFLSFSWQIMYLKNVDMYTF